VARGSGAAALAGRGAGDRAFLLAGAFLFAASAAGTIWWCGSMSGGMPMPGGWTMSMAWMRMPGQSWPGAAASFLAAWTLMMAAMMLPSLVPALSRYRRAEREAAVPARSALVAIAGAGYLLVWAVVGTAAYPLGVVLAVAEMRWPALARSVPIAAGLAVVAAGALQLSAWKARQLACCRDARRAARLPPDARDAWRFGLGHGVRCCLCCSPFTVVLLVTGVMDVGAMAAIAAAITVERLAPWPGRAARLAGVVMVAAGAVAIALAIAA
jgi:predicted metal-binding membrane protein